MSRFARNAALGFAAGIVLTVSAGVAMTIDWQRAARRAGLWS